MSTPPEKPAGREQRVQLRKTLRTRVLLSAPNQPPIAARSFDISAGGMGLVADMNLPIGLPCDLGFAFPFSDGTSAAVRVSAAVAYCVFANDVNGFRVGVQFKGLSGPFSAALVRFLKG